MSVLCLGEALVDLICEHPVASAEEADSFRPYFGGAAANVCVAAARHGAKIALAGGVGDDPWGRWLHDTLAREGVDLANFSLLPHAQTPVAFVTVTAAGEPDFAIYGDGIALAVESAAAGLATALAHADGFVFASNTLVGPRERAVTLKARQTALDQRVPVVFDPNLRLARWPSHDEALTVVRGCIDSSFLVKCNAAEARLLSDHDDVETAAEAILAAGAANVIVTRGPDGAILRGQALADAAGVPAHVVNATGAGDAFLGVIVAALARSQFAPEALVEALAVAAAEASRATERWGAV